jgi:hypothetical protein
MPRSALHKAADVVQNKGDFMNDILTRLEYETMYLGKWVAQCAVHDNKGQHCPDAPVHYVEYRGEKVGLCSRCFLNFQNGAFDQERVKGINREDRLYIRTETDKPDLCKGMPHGSCKGETWCKKENPCFQPD